MAVDPGGNVAMDWSRASLVEHWEWNRPALPGHKLGQRDTATATLNNPQQVECKGGVARQVEEYMEDLAAGSGHYFDLSLKSLDSLLDLNFPPLPRRYPEVERAALDAFLTEFPHLFSWLDIYLLRDALDQSLLETACADQSALALSAVCIGLPGRAEWSYQGGTARPWPGLEYFRSAWAYLQNVKLPSLLALYACHCLNHVALICCGAEDQRSIVRCMVWHAETFVNQENRDNHIPVLFSTYYKDSLLAALIQLPPYASTGFAQSMAHVEQYRSTELGHGPAPDKMMSALVDLERHVATGSNHTSGDHPSSAGYDLEVNRKMDRFAHILAAEQRNMTRQIACHYAHIRYSWARILNIAPSLHVEGSRTSSLSIISRSATRIIRSYDALSHIPTIMFGWGELRRLSTAAWVIARCVWEDELDIEEGQALLQCVVSMCEVRWTLWEPGQTLLLNLRNFAPLIGLEEIARGSSRGEVFLSELKSLSRPATFDYTVPK